jgi:hypothetical protein
LTAGAGVRHLIINVANHYEPAWRQGGGRHDLRTQIAKVESWCSEARLTGNAVRDHDGAAFQHTNFYPAEQYHPAILEQLAELQADGFGEVEIHLHHGVEQPDTAANLRRSLIAFRDLLAERHRCLATFVGDEQPKYGFVHGNFALANSRNGFACGVDEELQVLAETGCYADFTLPSFPWPSQVARINAIYQCGHPLAERAPHRAGPSLQAGQGSHTLKLPVIFAGPLVLDWSRRTNGLPLPRIEDGVITEKMGFDAARLALWRQAGISVSGRAEWVFIKLYCHGFFAGDQEATIGGAVRRFWTEVMELAERTGEFQVHFASARESFNIAMAATDGKSGAPGLYRNYRLRQIMETSKETVVVQRAAG